MDSGMAPITKNSIHTIMQGKKPMEKNVSVIDEKGRIIGTTYPKRAKGLVNSGRARYVSCESKDTICLTCPPDKMEDNTMTDNSFETAFTDTLDAIVAKGNETVVTKYSGDCTPSAEYALRMLEKITTDTEAIKLAVAKVSHETDNGVAHIIDAREETNRKLIDFYTQMYNEFKPTVSAQKSNTVSRFEEIAAMIKGLNRDDYDESTWNTLMEAAKAQLSRNY